MEYFEFDPDIGYYSVVINHPKSPNIHGIELESKYTCNHPTLFKTNRNDNIFDVMCTNCGEIIYKNVDKYEQFPQNNDEN